jgi:hypothetical protein
MPGMALAAISVLIGVSLIKRSRYASGQAGVPSRSAVPRNGGKARVGQTRQPQPFAPAPPFAATPPSATAPPAGAKPGFIDRLNAVSTLIMAAAIVATLLVSYATLRSQLDDRNAAAAAAAQAAKLSFASKVVFWWTSRTAKTTEAVLHVQNDNAQPADVWAVYLSRNASAPSLGGAAVPPPFSFVGQVPPCKVIQVHAPFANWPHPHAFAVRPLLARGDLLFTDAKGLIWERDVAGMLRELPGSAMHRSSAAHLIISSGDSGVKDKWSAESAAPSCG